MIVFVAAEKGGTGKFTIANSIAVRLVCQNVDAASVDTDGQATCARFSKRHDGAGIDSAVPCVQWTGDVAATLRDLLWCYQVIVINAGGHDSRETQLAVAASNLLLVSTHASQADLETLPKVNELASLAQGLNPDLRAFVVLSTMPPNPTIREVDDTREALSQSDQLEFADTIIHNRGVYHDALLNGDGVVELSSSQACVEIQLFAQESFEVAAQARVFK